MVVPGDAVLLAGRYRLQDRIAGGGAGEVWRAADAVLGRAVAVKLLRPEYAGNGEVLARFRAEPRYAALVCHPGVVPVHDYGPGGPVGAPFLVMELVDGPSLAEVAACGPLEPAWVLGHLAVLFAPCPERTLAALQDDRAAHSAQAKAGGLNETNQSHRMDQRLLALPGS